MNPNSLQKALTIRPINKQRNLIKKKKRNEVQVIFIVEYYV
jgi:hypothetical protein